MHLNRPHTKPRALQACKFFQLARLVINLQVGDMPRPAMALIQVTDNAVSVHASHFFDIIWGVAYRRKLPNLIADELANDRAIQPLPAFAGDHSQPSHL